MTHVLMENIDKFFPSSGVQANASACLRAEPGEILAIVGENGAGKSTLVKILAGLEVPDSGSIFLNGRKVAFKSSREALGAKIGMVHQHFMLVDDFSVAENVVFGLEPLRFGFALNRRAMEERVDELAARSGFSLDVGAAVGGLGVGQRQQVEILRLLYRDAEVLILDEPTSVLADQEIESLFESLKELKKGGRTILVITHKVREVARIADSVSVLRSGRTIGRFDARNISENELSSLIMGGGLPASGGIAPRAGAGAEKVLEVKRVSLQAAKASRYALRDVSFGVRAGEIAGITAVGGNGSKELEDLLSGFARPSSGEILLKGRPLGTRGSRAAKYGDFGYVPSDRMRRGSCLSKSVFENYIAVNRGLYFPHGLLSTRKALGDTGRAISAWLIKAGATMEMDKVSGGNVQKLVLARELPEGFHGFALLCEPSWGLDIASTKAVHEAILNLRRSGSTCAVISSDPDEILELCDRILVLYKGRLVCDRPNDGTIDRRFLGRYMLGLEDDFAETRGAP